MLQFMTINQEFIAGLIASIKNAIVVGPLSQAEVEAY